MNAETAAPEVQADERPTLVMEPGVQLPLDEQPTEILNRTQPSSDDPGSISDEALARDLKLQVVDASQGVVAKAGDYADAYIAEHTTQRGARGLLKRIWHGNIARDYIRLRQTQRGRGEIVQTGNLHVLEDGSQADHDREMAAVVSRFTNDYLHSGERQDSLSNVEGGTALEAELRTLVNSFAQGAIDADALTEEKTRVLNRYKEQLHGEDRNKGLLLADNVLDVAQAARAAVRHGVAMDRIQSVLTANIGEARIGQRTEARRELTDKIVDKLYSQKVGSLLNESTLALAAGIGITAAKLTARKATTAAAATVGMGLGAGVIAGAREYAHIGQERQQHIRERAVGQQMPGGSAKRRERLEETRYETVASATLVNQLTQAREAVQSAEPTSIESALQAISEAEARIGLSDQESVDLIDFSSTTSLEQERLQLDVAIAEAKVAASRALTDADETALQVLGIGRELDAALESRLEGIRGVLNSDITAKDAVFSKLRRNQTIKMAGVGLVTGLVVGEAVQEARALLSDSLQGVFEGHGSHVDRQTLLAGLLGHNSVNSIQTNHTGHILNVHEVSLDKNATLDLPPDYHLQEAGQGHWNLMGPGDKASITGLTVDNNGHLSEASKEALSKAGYRFGEQSQSYLTHHLEHHEVHRTAQEYLSHHPGDFTHVNRQLWYDNNTPNVFDLNELKLWWGGANNTGLDNHGNFVFNVAQMSPDGSFHDGFSANAQQLIHEGKMAIALSMTKGTQSHVVLIPIDKQGNAVIKANSWMAHSLFEKQDGQAHFIGAYAEAVQLMGKHNGVETMRTLATEVGTDQPKRITDIVSHLATQHHERIVTQIIPSEHGPGIPIEIPPVYPIYARRGLEALENSETPIPYIGASYLVEGYRDREGLMPRRGLAPFAPELETNPDATINPEESTRRYLRSLRPSYRRTVDGLSKDLAKEPKAAKPKVVVMIPAAAHQEGRNIRNTLNQYAQQQEVGSDEFEVVVFANYPKGAQRDQTVSEVKKFQKENPNIKVRLIEKRLEENEANIGWIRKALTDAVVVDLMDRKVSLDEAMLVSNDADSRWINPRYLRTIIDKAEASPETDGFLGFIDWGYDAYKAHPEMLAATRFMQMIEIYLRIAKHEIGSSGANFAFRPGIYSAIGGYIPGTPLAEDVVLGRMIKSVRAGTNTRRPIAFLGRSSEVNTSARRALDKLFKDGGAPAAQWDEDFGVNDELRNRDFDLRNFDLSDETAVEQMIASTERMLNQTLRIYSTSLQSQSPLPSYRQGRLTMYDNETIRQINRICFFIGVNVDWQPDGSIKIVDAQKMISGLRDWQARH